MTDASDLSAEDLDDGDALAADTARERARLAGETPQRRLKRELRNDAGRDHQDFRDAIDASLPTTALDEMAEASRENEEIEQIDLLEALRNLQTGDPIRWKIFRIGHENQDLNGFLCEWSTSQLTQERIKDEFGGGTYRIRGQRSDGKYAGGRTIRIAGDAIRKEKTNMTTQQPQVSIVEFMTAQESRDAARRREEEQRRERERADQERREDQRRKERNELLAIVVPAITGLTTAIVGAFTANRGPDLGTLLAAVKGPDPLVLLTQLKQLEDKPNNDGVLMKVLPMLLERASDSAREGDTGWLDVVKELAKSAGPAVGGMIEAAMAQAKANAASNPASTNTPPYTANVPMTVRDMGPMSNPTNATLGLSPPAEPALIVVPEQRPRRERRTRSVNEPSNAGLPVTNNMPPGSPANTAGGSSPSTPLRAGIPGESDMNLLQLMPLMKHRPWLVEQLARLGPAAARGKDPELYAALFLEELPEDVPADVLGGLLSREDWFALLAGVDPRINSAELYPWFEALRGYILQSLSQEVAPQQTVAPQQPLPPEPRPVSVTNPAPKRTGEIERPTKIPSLTGETD